MNLRELVSMCLCLVSAKNHVDGFTIEEMCLNTEMTEFWSYGGVSLYWTLFLLFCRRKVAENRKLNFSTTAASLSPSWEKPWTCLGKLQVYTIINQWDGFIHPLQGFLLSCGHKKGRRMPSIVLSCGVECFCLNVWKCAVCVCGSLPVCFCQWRYVFSMSYTEDGLGADVLVTDVQPSKKRLSSKSMSDNY